MKFKNMLSIIMVVILCVALFSGCGEDKNAGNITTTNTTEPATASGKTITIVGGMEGVGFYENLKKGGEEAAKKYGFALEYVGVKESEQSDSATHINKLHTALEKDTSGVVVIPVGEGYADILGKLYDEKIPVVQIDSIEEDDIEALEARNKNPIASTVSTDYTQAGAVCAEKMFEIVKENIKQAQGQYVIGVIEREESAMDEEKAYGFYEKFTELADADESTRGKYKIETENGGEALDELMAENVMAVFITHPEIADKLSDAVSADKEKYNEVIFCGFDSGAKQLKWLKEGKEKGFIGGVAQDSYNLGFNAVEQCILATQGKDLKPDIKIKAHWYDKTNLDKMTQENIVFEK